MSKTHITHYSNSILKLTATSAILLSSLSFQCFADNDLFGQGKGQTEKVLSSFSTADITDKININSATVAQLRIPKLIGEKRAQALADWIDKNGPITSFDQLLSSSELNIGPKTIDALKQKFSVGDAS